MGCLHSRLEVFPKKMYNKLHTQNKNKNFPNSSFLKKNDIKEAERKAYNPHLWIAENPKHFTFSIRRFTFNFVE